MTEEAALAGSELAQHKTKMPDPIKPGPAYVFASGGALCTLARSPELSAIMDVPLIAA